MTWTDNAYFWIMRQGANSGTLDKGSVTLNYGTTSTNVTLINNAVYLVYRASSDSWRVFDLPTTVGTSLGDVMTITDGALAAVDAGADQIPFWDDSAGKIVYATIGSGLTMTGTTLTSASGKIGAAETTLYTSGIQTLTTTPTDVTGSSQTIVPTSTTSTLLYSFSFMMASTGAGAGYAFLHFYRDGAEITSAKTTCEVENARETRVTVQFAVANTSLSSTTFKLQARIYTAQPVKLHETVTYDGSASAVSSSATVSVIEIID